MADNGQIFTTPTKRFFVEMFTRDIELDEAILDLLDNCVDGALRVRGYDEDADRPYKDFRARLHFSADEFSITDNCGGIPDDLREQAFRLGRAFGPDKGKPLPMVGVYGIGMKRAIFKLGRECTIESRTKASGFRVTIPHEWFTTEDDWALPITEIEGDSKKPGTTITVRRLLPPVARSFGSPTGFAKEFGAKVSQYYSVLIEKGFNVQIEKRDVAPIPITFKTSEFEAISEKDGGIAPYLFDGKVSGVDVELACGFYTPYSEDSDDEATQFKTDEAGWTVICNDRVVVYKDKTLLTGWGDGAPNYHPQFRQIAGVVVFSSKDPKLLPVTTTKRGIDGNSEVYLRVRQKMRDALRKFTSFTNKLKNLPTKTRDAVFERTKTVELADLRARKAKIPARQWTKDQKIDGRTYDPPLPKFGDDNMQFVRFSRSKEEIRKVSKFLFDAPDEKPAEVGGACFDRTLKEAKNQ